MPLTIGTTTKPHGKITTSKQSDWKFELQLIKHLEKTTNIPRKNFIYGQQTHGTNVNNIKILLPKSPIPDTDALITNLPNTLLLVKHADCVPIFFHDPATHTIAIAHSGFQGTMDKIAANTIRQMQSKFHCQPKNIQITLGPSAQPCCYTFTDIQIFQNKPDWKKLVLLSMNNESEGPCPRLPQYSIDLPSYITHTLIQSGIPPKNIQNQNICTIHNDNYHSWRYNKAQGRPLELGVSYIAIKR
jgi:YfiH family protein